MICERFSKGIYLDGSYSCGRVDINNDWSSSKRHGCGARNARCPPAIVNKTGNGLPGCRRFLDLRFRVRLRGIMLSDNGPLAYVPLLHLNKISKYRKPDNHIKGTSKHAVRM